MGTMPIRDLCLIPLTLAATFLLAQAPAQTPAPRKAPAKKRVAIAPAKPEPTPDAGTPEKGPFPIRAFQVKGTQQLTPDNVVLVSGLKLGQKIVAADIETAMQRMVASGYFERVGYRYEPGPEGVTISWEVVEANVFYPYAFEEFPVKPEEAKKLLKEFDPLFSDKIPATNEFINRYANALNTTLKLEGEARIAGRLTTNEKGEFYVRFRPMKPRPAVYSVDFTGNKLISSEELRPPANASASGVPYNEKDFRMILDGRIRPLYEARGRMGVVFTRITATPLKDNELALNVVVEIQEGDEFKLREVRFAGPGAQVHNWDQIASFRTDEVVNMAEVEEGRKKMLESIRKDGYLDATVTQNNVVDTRKKLVDVEMNVELGPVYTFDKLDVKGLDLISEPVVRKMWNLKPGAPYNPEYPDFFLKQLRDDGIFDNLGETKAIPNLNREKHTVGVLLTFKGEDPNHKRDPRRPGGVSGAPGGQRPPTTRRRP